MSRAAIYWATNGCFLLIMMIGAAVGSLASIHPLYLAVLFATCTTPLFKATAFNDRYALLVIFSAVYFQYFGTIDLINLFRGAGDTQGVISNAEAVILVGAILIQLFYRLAANAPIDRTLSPIRDWPEQTLLMAGVLIWAVATWFTWQFKVDILTEATAAATARGLGSISALQTIGYLLANMMQPLGILIIAYVQCRYQRSYLLPLLIAVVLVQLILGFVIDVKGEALIGAVLVVVTRLLVNGRIPKGWIITIIVFIAVAFPAMQANRTLRSQYRLDNTAVAANLMEMIKSTFSKADEITTGTQRAQTVFERASLKGSVELIVARTGVEVPFQLGHTLSPLYAAFVPKIIWRDKPDVSTGQLMNKEFRVTIHSYTYISPSHIGELYWNFGWPGVIGGMALLGWLLGFIGKRIDMMHASSITQLMIAAITVRQMVLGFESTIAACYVVWLRSCAGILLLHWLFARRNNSDRPEHSDVEDSTTPMRTSLPNLMR